MLLELHPYQAMLATVQSHRVRLPHIQGLFDVPLATRYSAY